MKELIEIQAELKAPKNQRNNFGKYNYRSCEDILEAVKPLLKKHNCILTLTEETKELAGQVIIEAIAKIVSEDLIDVKAKASAGVDFQAKGMQTPQRFGAASSYARKYALGGLFLLDDNKDADATNTHEKEPEQVSKPKMPDSALPKAIEAVKNNTATIEQIQTKYNLTKEQLNELKNA